MDKNAKIKNLVFSGGSIKGFSFLGCMKALKQYKILNDLENITGTSIGSLFATLIILDYSSEELYSIISKFNIVDFHSITTDNIFTFFDNYGIDSGDEVLRIIEILIKAKTNNSKITFKELYDLTKIRLIVTATCLNTKKTMFYDYIDHPNEIVSISIRKSISIPFLFKPVIDNGKYYVDGAVMNNFPINLFEHEMENTLGVIIYNEDYSESENIEINSFETYIMSIIDCNYKEYVRNTIKTYFKNLVIIKTNISFLNFFIDNNERDTLIKIGYDETISVLAKRYVINILDYGNLLDENKLIQDYKICENKYTINKSKYKLFSYENNAVIFEEKNNLNFKLIGKLIQINNYNNIIDNLLVIKKNNIEYKLKKYRNLHLYVPIINKSIKNFNEKKIFIFTGNWDEYQNSIN